MIPCRFCGSPDQGAVFGEEANICPDCILKAFTVAMEIHEVRTERFDRETRSRKRRMWRAIRDRIHYRPMR